MSITIMIGGSLFCFIIGALTGWVALIGSSMTLFWIAAAIIADRLYKKWENNRKKNVTS